MGIYILRLRQKWVKYLLVATENVINYKRNKKIENKC